MLQFDNLSRIGFGSYRASANSAINKRALKMALDAGCNVLDTAPNYSLGEAEELIGGVLKERLRENLFIMTKGGYLQGVTDNELKRKLSNIPGAVKFISPEHQYSIHPDFLKHQIHYSLKRLKTSYIDGFFLHNPHYLEGDEQSGQCLLSAIEFLEDMVHKKLIRYYGISSARLSMDTGSIMSVSRLESMARQVSPDHHLKLFQFPFNLLESDLLKTPKGMPNFMEHCKETGSKTFGNRPLNAYLANGKFIRLAATNTSNKKNEAALANDFLSAYKQVALDASFALKDDLLTEWPKLIKTWSDFQSDESVQSYFQMDLFPELSAFSPNGLSNKTLIQLNKMKNACIGMARKNMSAVTRDFYRTIFSQFDIPATEYARTAIKYCQLSGIDCVLTGIRKPSYFKEIKDLL